MKRIIWFDGLRGVSAFLVFVHHFSLLFFSAIYYGNDAKSMLANGLDAKLSQSPFLFF